MTDLELRHPVISDANKVYELTKRLGELDLNSLYHYITFCRLFSKTSTIAAYRNEIIGFCNGCLIQTKPSTLFIWQIGVIHPYRRSGIARDLVEKIIGSNSITRIEATIGENNARSWGFFESLSQKLNGKLCVTDSISANDYPKLNDSEILINISI